LRWSGTVLLVADLPTAKDEYISLAEAGQLHPYGSKHFLFYYVSSTFTPTTIFLSASGTWGYTACAYFFPHNWLETIVIKTFFSGKGTKPPLLQG
jgi:hypothetical protein